MKFKQGEKVRLKNTGIIREPMCNKTCYDCMRLYSVDFILRIDKIRVEEEYGRICNCSVVNIKNNGSNCSFHPDDLEALRIKSWKERLE